MEWAMGDEVIAKEIFRKLLRSNPEDNIGARNMLLAITMGFPYIGFELKFDRGGHYDFDLLEWFNEHHHRYPEEFDWWIKWAEKQGF